MDEFEFWQSLKLMAIVVTTLAPSFLIGSSLLLQVKRSTMGGFEYQPDQALDFGVNCH